ncbi:hypothetical protein [Paenibacillus xylanilyticus]|uniref:Lipoprotein SmpA/OmlA domain-containing protein n=1 Tax=Paenibacillus xylanilyticus TaxID=248903 RepID=A0A7Y6BUZ7_9BACL|nr:hypothetical protein [Paenibacillus xylanilyticus]NUU74449.1 hypothetical protein [Paenibacillus xylanilyticus]
MKRMMLSVLLLLILSACNNNQFDKETWLTEPEKRNSMVYSLKNKYELIGMTETEIIDLLGEPAQKVNEPSLQYVYYMGRAGYGVDDSLLRLNFNKDSEIESHEVTND